MRCDLLDRQGCVRRAAGGILNGLQPEDRHDPPGAHLLDPTAEALDLLHEGFERGAHGGDNVHRRHRDEINTEQSDMPVLPLHSDRLRSCRGIYREAHWLGGRGRFGRPGRRPQSVLLEAVAQDITGHP